MRILVISNYYPPYYVGGYELGCKDVVDRLMGRGHDVIVLTSTYSVESEMVEDNVYRLLRLQQIPKSGAYYKKLFKLARIGYKDSAIIRNFIRKFSPDVINVWHVSNLPISILTTIDNEGIPVVYSVSDHWIESIGQDKWLQFWERVPRSPVKRKLKNFSKSLLSSMVATEVENLNLKCAYFTSETLKRHHIEAGLAAHNAEVIYWGVDTSLFVNSEKYDDKVNPVKLLYAGRIIKEKGIHTAVDAVCKLVNKGHKNFILNIVGAGNDPDYIQHLRNIFAKGNAVEYVKFIGKVPREKMVDVYNSHHILLFPSIWEEPFSITILEAMACGLAVIGTTTGGSQEILIDEENSLTFAAGNSEDLARQIEKLIFNPDLRKNISLEGQKLIKEKFDIELMIDQIEAYLRQVTGPREAQ